MRTVSGISKKQFFTQNQTNKDSFELKAVPLFVLKGIDRVNYI